MGSKSDLVESLLTTFNIGKSRITKDTKISIDKEGKSFSTYSELCSVANEMGQPALIYKFLDLASHHSIWNSRLGAAFSLGSIISADKELLPKLAQLIPKLFRYQFDPNTKIKDAMGALWKSLVTDPRQVRGRKCLLHQ